MIMRQQIEQLNEIQKMVEEYVREEAKRQGIEESGKGYRLTPAAMRVFQRKVLQEIFSDLQAARSGRHAGPIAGEGAVGGGNPNEPLRRATNGVGEEVEAEKDNELSAVAE